MAKSMTPPKIPNMTPLKTPKTAKESIEVDVWVRGMEHATTHTISSVPADAADWSDSDVQQLLTEMLLALERDKNPDGEAPLQVTLRGFSWIVSPYDGGVVVHLEMQMGTASAGPFAIDEQRLVGMIQRVMHKPLATDSVH
jgi:hypothetical protein